MMELKVESVDDSEITTRVVNGGVLKPHKGVNLPGVALPISAITDKDRADLQFAIQHQADYIALSFVRRAEDVLELKRLIASWNATIPVISKIEKPEAVEHIDSILEVSDGVMVARGDLGVEVAPEQVPMFQKTIIRKANAVGKPVITATQMLESMINNPRPTRAEASDVANAILDGTDAVMLSGETAVGEYPVEAVQMMSHIALAVESDIQFHPVPRDAGDALSVTDAIGIATCEMAMQLKARVIVTATSSGFTARMIARHRPLIPIFAVTTSPEVLRQLALVWGVRATVIPPVTSMERMVAQSLVEVVEDGVAKQGDVVILTAGVPVGVSGRTNMIQVRQIGEIQ
jgi:pyruvate kinase